MFRRRPYEDHDEKTPAKSFVPALHGGGVLLIPSNGMYRAAGCLRPRGPTSGPIEFALVEVLFYMRDGLRHCHGRYADRRRPVKEGIRIRRP